MSHGRTRWEGGRTRPPSSFPGCSARQRRGVFQPYSHMCFPSVVAGVWGGVCLPRPVTQPSDSCGIAEPSPFSGPRPPRPFPRSFQHADQGLIFSLSSCLISHQRGCCVSSSSSRGADQGSGPSQAIITSRPRGSVCGNHVDSGHTSVIISLGRTRINGKQRCLLLRPAY